MIFVQILILIAYAFSLLFIFIYTLSQAHLVWLYLRIKRQPFSVPEPIPAANLPLVTIQLPVYNEMYVMERLIDSVCLIDYPKDKLQIQVLDDSTDDSILITQARIKQWKLCGFLIEHIKRTDRTGYKAGALKHGLETASGEFVAIFDADFIPSPDFLTKTLPHFKEANIGLVQTRWGHLNREYSILTKLQAFGLDAHFSIEQVGRNAAGSFINFNGTGGIWRKKTIVESGNWQSDTLTEDLDLSYRAQLKGWKFIYLENVISPAELPPVMSAVKTQQFRWTKGGAETARKHLRTVMSSSFSNATKFHGVMHLLNSSIFLAVLVCALLSVPLLFIKAAHPQYNRFFYVASFFLMSLLVIAVQYYVSFTIEYGNKSTFRKVLTFSLWFPLFLSFSMGLSLHNSIAVIQGLLNKKTAFIRTPKFNMSTTSGYKIENRYITKVLTPLTFMEGVLSFYFAFGVYQDVLHNDYTLLLFHVLLFTGFASVFYYSVRHSFFVMSKKLT